MLTGLINRQEFECRLERMLTEIRGNGAAYALLYLDLDRFKVAVVSYGRAGRHAVLRDFRDRGHCRRRAPGAESTARDAARRP
ncbi:MAG: diguanylate cyclase [Thiobacillus sp.]|nr:diguanylate cyclase [Thiobacillus sp.]